MNTIVPRAFAFAGLMLLSAPSYGDTSPYARDLARRSATSGVGTSDVALLVRSSPRSREEAATAVAAAFGRGAARAKATTRDDRLALEGDQWRVDVGCDGSTVEYFDAVVAARAHSLRRPLAEKMPFEQLDRLGRTLIQEKLGAIIQLSPDEALVTLGIDHRVEGGQARSGSVESAVVAHRVLFGRTVNGIPVLGGGSTVAVTYTNDGAIESMRADWPTYRLAGPTRPLLGGADMLARVQAVVAARTGAPPPATPVWVTDPAAPYPIQLTSQALLETMECGYFDPGGESRDSAAPVQPGCVYHAWVTTKTGLHSGLAGAVPAANAVEADRSWPEASWARRTPHGGSAPPPSAAPGSKKPPPLLGWTERGARQKETSSDGFQQRLKANIAKKPASTKKNHEPEEDKPASGPKRSGGPPRGSW